MKLTKEINKLIREGSWAFPTTPKQLKALKDALKKPVPSVKAADVFYNILGDDDLYDFWDETIDRGEGKKDDVRNMVKNHIKKTLNDYADGETSIKGLTPEIAKKLAAIVK